MHAITVSDYGAGPAVTELPRPRPKPGQVLIAVQAAGLNPMDMEIANGGLEDRLPAHVALELAVGLCRIVEAEVSRRDRLESGRQGLVHLPGAAAGPARARYGHRAG